jgi:hypothetical protein
MREFSFSILDSPQSEDSNSKLQKPFWLLTLYVTLGKVFYITDIEIDF